MKGRVASLLEVGTGMHPEMTARQNIYLNGSLMGMSRNEITSKLNEIIEFAGIEKYVDTPIKRFSSGMKVRLGFAIAAFLEPEILIVDEVLAVGDAEFQKKAIGKMQEVSSGGGRTVLFVSHNMASVASLCSKGIILDRGQVSHNGSIGKVIDKYRIDNFSFKSEFDFKNRNLTSKDTWISDFVFLNSRNEPTNAFEIDDILKFKFNIQSNIKTTISLRVVLFDVNENRILSFDSNDVSGFFETKPGKCLSIESISEDSLNIKPGSYNVNISAKRGTEVLDHIINVTTIEIIEKDIFGFGRFKLSDMGLTIRKHKWKIKN